MRRDLLYLLALLALISLLASRPERKPSGAGPSPGEFELSLSFTSRPDWRGYTLYVTTASDGTATWTSSDPHDSGIGPDRDAHGTLRTAEWRAWRTELELAGLWDVANGSEPATNNVLYTRLNVRDGHRRHTSTWVGLPGPGHRALAREFVEGPLGVEIRTGLRSRGPVWGSGLDLERGSNAFPGEN